MPEGTTQDDLHAQIAQRVFGWVWNAATDRWWMPPDNEPVLDEHLPAYSTDPVATALVWQWLEARGQALRAVYFDYTLEDGAVVCWVQLGQSTAEEAGATWPEALCRAALALAAALDTGEGSP